MDRDFDRVKKDVLLFSSHQVLEEKEWRRIFANAASNVDK